MSEFGRELSNFQEAMPTARIGRAIRRKVLSTKGRFDCGIRVVEGRIDGERASWKSRPSRIEHSTLHHGSRALPLELLEQIPHPGGFRVSARCVVWRARETTSGAIVELAFLPADAATVLGSELANGKDLRLDATIEDL